MRILRAIRRFRPPAVLHRLAPPLSSSSSPSRDRFYLLSMFPYPSGNLHMGHARIYALTDTLARFHRLSRRPLLNPMGWDAFGLPAENAARDHRVPAHRWTATN